MKTELIKQLKEAGFPLELTDHEECKYQQSEIIDGVCYHIPNLSELMNACEFPPDIFSHEITLKKFAYGDEGYRYEAYVCCQNMEVKQYKTPETAMAKLWLKINKKQ